MSINLDLDDVVYDQPLAQQELRELRSEIIRLGTDRARYLSALRKIQTMVDDKYGAHGVGTGFGDIWQVAEEAIR